MSKYNVFVSVLLVIIAYVAIMLFKMGFATEGIIFVFLFVFMMFQFETNTIKTGIVYENVRSSFKNNNWRMIVKNRQTQRKKLVVRKKPLPRGLFFKNEHGDLVVLKVTTVIIK